MTIKEQPATAEPKVETLGEFTQFGRYTIFFLIAAELLLLPEVMNMTFMIYGGVIPKVSNCGKHNLTHLSKDEVCSQVAILKNETGCQPSLVADFQSLGYEFKKYCGTSVEVKGIVSLCMFGALVGSIVFGQLSDGFGRKRMLLIAHAGMFIFDFFASQARSLYEFAIIQLITMFFAGAHSSILHVYLLENVPKRHRLWVTCLLTYSPNYVITAGLAYLAKDWRTLLQLASALNVLSFGVLMIAFESPRWYIQKGRLKQARATLRRIELINGTQTEERLVLLDNLIEEERRSIETQKRKRQYYFYHLFYNVKSTLYTFTISYALVCTSVLTFATVFNLEYLTGSLYLNISMYGAFRYFINITVGVLDFHFTKLGRKLINNSFLSVILVLLTIVAGSKLLGLDEPMLVRLCVLCSASLASQLYMLNAVITSELFPTGIRNVAASFIQLFSRLGGVAAPHLFYLSVFWDPLPFIIMLLIITANLVLFNAFIPETKHNNLSDHLPEKRKKYFQAGKPLLNQNGAEIPPKNNSAAGLIDEL
ncbi:MFS domain-containing protein [Aphelenchoides bicaudatus]|nr:MFS domain-containing protein [Aphelenchoides bicaudatus]